MKRATGRYLGDTDYIQHECPECGEFFMVFDLDEATCPYCSCRVRLDWDNIADEDGLFVQEGEHSLRGTPAKFKEVFHGDILVAEKTDRDAFDVGYVLRTWTGRDDGPYLRIPEAINLAKAILREEGEIE